MLKWGTLALKVKCSETKGVSTWFTFLFVAENTGIQGSEMTCSRSWGLKLEPLTASKG